MTDLALVKITGLSYDDVRALPREVYEVIVEDLNKHADEQQEAEPA
jgi:hypothetical protein